MILVFSYSSNYDDYPAQCILVIDMIKWTERSEEAIKKEENGETGAIKDSYEKMIEVINQCVNLVKGELTVAIREMVKA